MNEKRETANENRDCEIVFMKFEFRERFYERERIDVNPSTVNNFDAKCKVRSCSSRMTFIHVLTNF